MRHLFQTLPAGVMPVDVRMSVGQVLNQSLPVGSAAWSAAGSQALASALGELQSTADGIEAAVFAKTKRGRVMDAMIQHQGMLHTACMTIRVRDELREAARIISQSGIEGRRLVYEAALQILGEDRPEDATVH